MEKVASSIKDLLLESNRVIVPDFGAFIGKVVSAKIDENKNVIHPPSKTVSFNDRLKLNDDFLAKYISSKEDVEITRAKTTISEFVNAIKSKLESDGKISIAGLGSFIQNGPNVTYMQDNSINFNGDAFGLQPVSLPGGRESSLVADAVEKDKNGLKRSGTAAYNDDITDRRQRRDVVVADDEEENRSSVWLMLFIPLILGLLAFAIWKFYDSGMVDRFTQNTEMGDDASDSNFNRGKNEIKTGVPTPADQNNQKPTGRLSDNPNNRSNTGVNNTGRNTNNAGNSNNNLGRNNNRPGRYPSSSSSASSSPGKRNVGKWGSLYTSKKGYYIIIGSVQDKALAEKMAADLRAFDQYEGYILSGPSGFNRIAIYSGNDRKNAEILLQRLQRGYSADSWIYEKK